MFFLGTCVPSSLATAKSPPTSPHTWEEAQPIIPVEEAARGLLQDLGHSGLPW